jgi:hypothetical protein
MKVEVSYSPSQPRVGEEVVFDIVVTDDGPTCGSDVVKFGDGEGEEIACDPVEDPGYGPWTPPPRQSRQYTHRATHAYRQPGQYTATFEYSSTRFYRERWSPYSDSGSASVTFTVKDGLVG